MPRFKFPASFRHDHPPVQDINKVMSERMTAGQKTADTVAQVMGSWPFIIVQSVVLGTWVVFNVMAWIRHWDPYPFILLNLFLSLQAAYAAPIIMMSQNRQAARDRIEAHNDYLLDQKAELEVQAVLKNLEAQNLALLYLSSRVDDIARAVGIDVPVSAPASDS